LLAIIIDAATGVNHHILSYSKYYPIELYLLLLMAVLNILFNFLLIPKYGIDGAAFATFASVCIYNILKTAIVYVKLRIHPFSNSLWFILILGISIALLSGQIQLPFSPLLNLLITSAIISILFLGCIYFFKLSEEFTNVVDTIFEKGAKRNRQ
jgi:O-antigen/teichoic acid export membrane protein